jgi:7-cyano-7-deazaguanine synthase
VADLYGAHWATTGRGVPDADTPDEAVYLPGRNLMLLAKVAVFCERRGIGDIALAPLSCNPFGDNTDEFYEAMRAAGERALGCGLRFLRPYARLDKSEVVRRGRDLPLQLTFSCMRPAGGLHCGACNKCAERIRGFAEAGVPDLTVYANRQDRRKVTSA